MLAQDLASLIGSDAVSTDTDDLSAHATDWWPLSMLNQRMGRAPILPAVVVRPRTPEDVAAVLRYASEHGTPVVPFGGGSGVCGGVDAVAGSIALDTRAFDSIRIDADAMLVHAGAGVMGPALEAALNAQGLTLGHFPQSIEISTVGGWVATRSAGQKSSRYGRIDDMLVGLQVASATGEILNFPARAGTAAGPDLMRLYCGSEGTLGVITSVTLQAWPQRLGHQHHAFSFDRFTDGLQVLRAIARARLTPAVTRLYDPTDALISFRDRAPGGAVAILRFEGAEAHDLAEADATLNLISKAGGQDLGPSLADHWWEHRNNAVRTLPQIMLEGSLGAHAAVDTIEVSGLWPVDNLYRRVRDALDEHAGLVGCHASHIYPRGTCLYFTFVFTGATSDEEVTHRYHAAWNAAIEATLAASGSITHHHGIGLLRAPWMERELQGGGMDLLRAIKRTLDPAGIMNPGKLGLGPRLAPPEDRSTSQTLEEDQ